VRKYNPNSARPRIFDGATEAKLIALACSPTPEDFARWTLRLLEEKVVELNIVEKASDNAIGRTLKKNTLQPHRNRQWVIPPDANAAFLAAMEDVLETYQKPRDPDRPLVCLDETSKQLVVETRKPIPAKPGQPVRYDYEYARNGVADIFMMFAALEGWRKVKVTDHHAAVDYAQVLKELSDVHFPDAKQIVLVQDNLSTHTAASLYAAFPAEEARRLATRFERHSTPKHGSWLDMAESTRRSEQPMPGSPHSRQANPRKSGRRLGNTSKHASRQSRLAIHDQRRPRQTQEAIPPILSDSGH